MRPSNPALLAASRTLFEQRGQLVSDWAERISGSIGHSRNIPVELQHRQLRLLVDLVAELAGPLRREAGELWEKACEHYGRTAAARGLAAGEVAEEFGGLREILTRDLAAGVAALRPRRALAVLLHLNRTIDRGTAVAVAGYTDTLVAGLFAHDGVPSADNELEACDVEKQLAQLEVELRALPFPANGGM